MSSNDLIYNTKPKGVMQLLPLEALQECCKAKEINTIWDLTQNVLEHYKASENLYLENYENRGF